MTASSGPARVAVAGCGAVGGALIDRIVVRRDLDPWVGSSLQVVRVLVRDADRPRPRSARAIGLTTDVDAFLGEEADIVVEALGGLEPAYRIARDTLIRGASLVTANKALIARHGATLQRLAHEHAGQLLFEAAVAGGVPVLRTIRHSFAGASILAISGILNGTSNWLLTEIESGSPFRTALGRAQRLGYAEADPTRDLDGRDAADKIRILAWQAWGADPAVLDVRTTGLPPDPTAFVRDARAEGSRIRMVAECRLDDGRVVASVCPVCVAPASAFGSTLGINNCVRVETDGAGTYQFSGPGAGGAATASAIMTDLVWIVRRS